MAGYKLGRLAEIKLAEIYNYSFDTFGEHQADGYILSLHDAFARLAEMPRLGRKWRRWRRHEHGEHVIFYDIAADGIFIIRIFHRSENIVARMKF